MLSREQAYRLRKLISPYLQLLGLIYEYFTEPVEGVVFAYKQYIGAHLVAQIAFTAEAGREGFSFVAPGNDPPVETTLADAPSSPFSPSAEGTPLVAAQSSLFCGAGTCACSCVDKATQT